MEAPLKEEPPPPTRRRFLEEPAYLGRDLPPGDGYPPRRRFHWPGPLVLVPLGATVLEFSAGQPLAALVFLAIFIAGAGCAYVAVRREIRSELEPRHPRRYP